MVTRVWVREDDITTVWVVGTVWIDKLVNDTSPSSPRSPPQMRYLDWQKPTARDG